MKKLQFVLFIAFTFSLTAQNDQGIISYEETIKLEIDIPEEHREQLKGVIPDSRTSNMILLFNSTESIYKDEEGAEDEQVIDSGQNDSGVRMKMVFQAPDNQFYKSLVDSKTFEKQEFFGRDFLVSGELPDFEWKLVNEEKEILGFSCAKANYEIDDQLVEAWYTPQIPVSGGPLQYGGLPGMILEIDINSGQTYIVASHVNLKQLDKNAIQAPKKGKKLSQEEFNRIVEQKNKEREEEYGSGNGQVIIKQRGGE